PPRCMRSAPPPARRATIGCLAGVLAAASTAAPAAATAPPHPPAPIQRALDAIVAAGSPGASRLFRSGDRPIRLAAGRSNLDPVAPMRPALRTRIGGLTKTI